jgi:hypothetical protein
MQQRHHQDSRCYTRGLYLEFYDLECFLALLSHRYFAHPQEATENLKYRLTDLIPDFRGFSWQRSEIIDVLDVRWDSIEM